MAPLGLRAGSLRVKARVGKPLFSLKSRPGRANSGPEHRLESGRPAAPLPFLPAPRRYERCRGLLGSVRRPAPYTEIQPAIPGPSRLLRRGLFLRRCRAPPSGPAGRPRPAAVRADGDRRHGGRTRAGTQLPACSGRSTRTHSRQLRLTGVLPGLPSAPESPPSDLPCDALAFPCCAVRDHGRHRPPDPGGDDHSTSPDPIGKSDAAAPGSVHPSGGRHAGPPLRVDEGRARTVGRPARLLRNRGERHRSAGTPLSPGGPGATGDRQRREGDRRFHAAGRLEASRPDHRRRPRAPRNRRRHPGRGARRGSAALVGEGCGPPSSRVPPRRRQPPPRVRRLHASLSHRQPTVGHLRGDGRRGARDRRRPGRRRPDGRRREDGFACAGHSGGHVRRRVPPAGRPGGGRAAGRGRPERSPFASSPRRR